MASTSRRGRSKLILSWVLATLLALGDWPTPAISTFAGLRVAQADESLEVGSAPEASATLTEEEEWYDVEFTTENTCLPEGNGSFMGLPEQSIRIDARGINKHADGTTDYAGFSYEWSLESGSEAFADITKQYNNDDGTSSAVVTFKPYDGPDFLCKDIYVHLTATKDGASVQKSIFLDLENEYPEIWVEERNSTRIDQNMAAGSTQQVTPQVRYYVLGQKCYTLGTICNLRWECNNDNNVSITYGDGEQVVWGENIPIEDGMVPTFTITRLNSEEEEIRLFADWLPEASNGPHVFEPADQSGPTQGQRHEHAIWNLHGYDSELHFEGEVPEYLVVNDSGSSVDLTIDRSNVPEDAVIDWTVGLCREDDWVEGHVFQEGTEYTVSGNTITINGEAALRHLGGYDEDDQHVLHVRAFAEAKLPQSGLDNPVIANATTWVDFVEPYVDYDYDRVWNFNMLPGWSNEVYRWYNARVWNEEYPYGEDRAYEVVDVTSSDEDVAAVEYREWDDGQSDCGKDHNWSVVAKDHGAATITVTYSKIGEDGKGSYDFIANVSSDVYSLDVWSGNRSTNALPGSTVELYAQGMHHREDADDTEEGLEYSWEVCEGENIGQLVVDEGDSKHASFAINSPGPDKMGFNDPVCVRVILRDGDGEVARSEWRFTVRNVYTELWPCFISGDLEAGEEVAVTPEVRSYLWDSNDTATLEDDYEVIDAEFMWDEVDASKIEVLDEDGNEVVYGGRVGAGTYTIRRKNGEGTGLKLRCWWLGRNGEECYEERYYQFDDMGDAIVPEENYDFERDRDMLPGWDGSVSGSRDVFVKNDEYPDGTDITYYVTDVQIIDGEDCLEDFHKDYDGDDEESDNYWWYFQAAQFGTATIQVTYQIPEELGGGSDSYTFRVKVADEVYGVDVHVCEGDSWALPGETIKLEAYGWRRYLDEDGEQLCEDTNDPKNGLAIGWGLDDFGAQQAKLAHASGTTNVLTMSATNDHDFNHGFNVYAELTRNGDVLATGNEHVAVCDAYPTITPYPADFPSHTLAGTSIEVTPRMLWRSISDSNPQEDDITESTAFDLCFDSGAVEVLVDGEDITQIEDNGTGRVCWEGKKTLLIKRLHDWDTELYLRANFETEDGQEEDSRTWRFEKHGYRLGFDGDSSAVWFTRNDDDTISDAVDVMASLWMSDELAAVENVDIEYTVGTGNWGPDGFEWDKVFGARCGVYGPYVDAEGNPGIKVYGAKLAELGIEDLRVVARATIPGDVELAESENDWWVHVKEREYEFGIEDRTLLPGDEGDIDDNFNIWMCDEDHPYGEDLGCRVSAVELVEGADVLEIQDNSDQSGHRWHYRAKNLGVAKLRVTYEYTGEEGDESATRMVTINVAADEYFFEGRSTHQMSGFILPGTSADVWLQGHHRHAVNQEGIWYVEDLTDGLVYDWDMDINYEGIATLVEDESDPAHVTIQCNVVERAPNPGAHATVSVALYDDGRQVARAGWVINFCDSFVRVEPTATYMDVLESESVTVDGTLTELWLGQDSTVVSSAYEPDDLEFFWSFDPESVRITNAAGEEVANSAYGRSDTPAGSGPYTITHLRNDDTELGFMVRWNDNGVPRQQEARYHVNPTHDLRHVEAKAATLTAEGNEEYWECVRCGKLFCDADATQETSIEDVTIAKLVNISTATITFPKRTYTGKKQTTLPTVTIGTATLAKGVDYKVSGSTTATDAGDYEVTVTGMGRYGGNAMASYTIAKKASAIKLAAQTKTYTGKALAYSGKVTKTGSTGKVNYKYYSDAACSKVVKAANVVGVGTYYVKGTVAADANHAAKTSAAAKFTIAKAAQPLTVKGLTATVSIAKVKKADQTLAVSKVLTVSKAQGKVTYKKASGNGKITVAKNGKVTVKKGLAKGKYKVKVTVTAAGNDNYKKGSQEATFTVVVK